MSKHTPGPWTIENSRSEVDSKCIVAKGSTIAVAMFRTHEEQANANLIAVAPDGYALAKEAIQWAKDRNMEGVPPKSGTGKMLANAAALIAKVEGKS